MALSQQRAQALQRPTRGANRPARPSQERVRALREPRQASHAGRRARAAAVAALLVGALVLVLALLLLGSGGGASAHKLTPPALAGSLMDRIGSPGPEDGAQCTAAGAGHWNCDVPDSSGSGGASYAVVATSSSCWRAGLTRLYGEDAPDRVAGCVH
jgi:hypothetical protein